MELNWNKSAVENQETQTIQIVNLTAWKRSNTGVTISAVETFMLQTEMNISPKTKNCEKMLKIKKHKLSKLII